MKNLIALLASLFFSILLLEGFLHLYNPFAPRIQGDQIVLPANKVYDIENQQLSRLAPHILHTKNSLGFRGPEPADALSELTSLICIGGSTTECFYIRDGQDWPAQLYERLKDSIPNLWINNAGLDGHSTWGHRLLLEQHVFKMKPKYLLMLCGINDLGRSDISDYDTRQIRKKEEPGAGIREWIIRHSQILSTIRTIRLGLKAQKQGVNHSDLKLSEFPALHQEQAARDSALASQLPLISQYGQRLDGIMKATKANGIQLILMTQPMLWGNTSDPVTGQFLGDYEITPGMSSGLRWELLQAYNQKAVEVALQNQVPVIPLADSLEKSTQYFYDEIHFTPEGCTRISEIIAPSLKTIMQP